MNVPVAIVAAAWLASGILDLCGPIEAGAYGRETDGRDVRVTAPTRLDTLTFRRIWKGNPYWFYGRPPSPDGRYLADVDWSTGDVALLDFHAKAETQDLYASPEWFQRVTDKGEWTSSSDFAESPVFSPDGRRIAYAWYAEDEEVDGYSLRIIGVDGVDLQVVLPASEDNGYLVVHDWSHDGTEVLITLPDRSETRLASVSVADGNTTVIGRRDTFGRAFFSPDGRFVAYDYRTDPGSFERDIRVLAADGSRGVDAVRGNGDDVLMGWSPDGQSIFFHSSRELSRGVWRQSISDGRADGEPEMVRSDVWQMLPYGFRGNHYYYGVVTKWPHVRTGILDVENGELVAPPTAVDDPAQAGSSHGVWSPDGRQIAYLKAQDPLMRRGDLAIRTLETAETRVVLFPFTDVRRLLWGPDARTIAVYGTHERRGGVHRFDLASGDVSTLVDYDYPTVPWPAVRSQFSPDGGTIYSIRQDAEVVALDVASGRETKLAAMSGEPQMAVRRIAVSKEGGTLALLEQATEPETSRRVRISLVPTAGGEPTVIYEDEMTSFFGAEALAWTPDGKYLLIGGFVGVGESRMYRLPTGGGELAPILDRLAVRGFELHPDGRRFASPSMESEGEIWVIDGLE